MPNNPHFCRGSKAEPFWGQQHCPQQLCLQVIGRILLKATDLGGVSGGFRCPGRSATHYCICTFYYFLLLFITFYIFLYSMSTDQPVCISNFVPIHQAKQQTKPCKCLKGRSADFFRGEAGRGKQCSPHIHGRNPHTVADFYVWLLQHGFDFFPRIQFQQPCR